MLNQRLISFWYGIKAACPTAIWLFPLLALVSCIFLLDMQADLSTRRQYVTLVAEIIFPLGGMFMANGLILREREVNTLTFVALRSRLTVLWLRHLSTLLLMSTTWLGLPLIIYRLFYLPFSLTQMVFASLAVSLALIGLSSVTSLMLKEMNGGYLLGSLWWMLCLINARVAFSVFGPRFYLFYLWLGAREGFVTDAWLLNKLTLGVMGLGLLLIDLFILRSTERFFT